MLMPNSKESIKVAHLQILTKQSMLNMIEMVNNSFSESRDLEGRRMGIAANSSVLT